MKARRTPWWCYVLAAALGLLAGMGLAKYGEISGLPLVGAPWIVPVVLAILGFVVLYMALQIHKYTTTDPEKRAQLETFGPAEGVRHTGVMQSVGRGRSGVGRLVWWAAHHEPATW